ncbi:hypothetical protein V8E55_001408 [Tylopilus felleus]
MVFLASESIPPNQYLHFLAHLQILLVNLPSDLPHGSDLMTSKYKAFLSFTIDEELLECTGSEVGAMNKQFKQVFGWKTHTTGDQILSIDERGKPITAVVDALEHFHSKYPKDNVLKKWGVDIAAGTYKMYNQYGLPVSPTESDGLSKLTCNTQLSLVVSPRPSAPSQFQSNSESTSTGNKGHPLKAVMNKLIVKFNNKGKKAWHCTASKCDHVRKGNPSKACILRHATKCPYLDATLKCDAIEASTEGSLGSQIEQLDYSHHPESPPSAEPPTKKSQTQLESQPTLDIAPFHQAGKHKSDADPLAMQKKVDHIILKLICVRDLVPTILNQPEWKELMQAFNPSYHTTSSSTFTDSYIPREAVFIRQWKLDELCMQENLTLTFDGTNTCKPHSIYTVHATTPARKSYFLDGYEESGARHNAVWIKDKIMKTIQDVGISQWAGICSDSTSVTKNAQRDIVASIPTMVDLNDVCHHIHNMIKDITKLSEFEQVDVVGIFHKTRMLIQSNSDVVLTLTYHLILQQVGNGDEKVHMLQRVGNTQFGTYWLATSSFEECFPNVRNLVDNKTIKFKDKKVQQMFLNRGEFQTMGREMNMYTSIVKRPNSLKSWLLS